MKKILCLLTLLLSLQIFAENSNVDEQEKKEIDVRLEKGDSTNEKIDLRTLIPITCVYIDGMVQLSLHGDVGEYTLTVTNQMTGERWSAENALILQTSTASGIYWVQIVTDDGSIYYGIYTL